VLWALRLGVTMEKNIIIYYYNYNYIKIKYYKYNLIIILINLILAMVTRLVSHTCNHGNETTVGGPGSRIRSTLQCHEDHFI